MSASTTRQKTFQPAQQERFSQTVIDGSEEFMRHSLGLSVGHEKEVEEFLIKKTVESSKASEAQQLKAVAAAYAIYVHDSFRVGGRLADEIAKEMGSTRTQNAKYDPIRFYLERTIFYGRDSGETKRHADWLYCRDARAIRHLMAKGVGPHQMVDLAKKRGEGLDHWANPRAESAKPESNEAEPSTSTSAAAAVNPEKNGLVLQLLRDGKVIENIEFVTAERLYLDGILTLARVYDRLATEQFRKDPVRFAKKLLERELKYGKRVRSISS